jgi:Do/DeqQ family serine protease
LRRLWLIFSQAVTVVLAALFVVATLKPAWLAVGGGAPWSGPLTVPATPTTSSPQPGGYRLAAQLAAPAVVSISANRPLRPEDLQAWQRWHRFGRKDGGDDGSDSEDDDGDGLPSQTGLGSGVIVSAQGHTLTNSHVVAGAAEIEVRLSDGRQAKARLIGADQETDVALLQISLPQLPVIAMGSSAELQVGDSVLAIGNPFNVGQTVTSGIVSALGRNQLGINTFENFIQTDAAINPGNSGGALVDAHGRLVGINTAIYSRTGGSLGIGFAVPVDTARQVMQALLQDGIVSRGWIGVQTRELTPEFVEAFRLQVKEGVLVSRVIADAPAAKAGIQAGDVITQVAGKPVRSPAELLAAVAALKPRTQASVSVQRGAQALQLRLSVAQRPPPQPQPED